MTPDQITLVKTSWEQVLVIQHQAAELFYQRLFTIAPDVRPLFKRDLAVQGPMLMATLNAVVSSLERLETMLPAVRNLARRHVPWGVKPEHYDAVGEALLWTLAQGLGPAFTAPVCRAWTAAYLALATVMKEAAYPAPCAAPRAVMSEAEVELLMPVR